MRLEIGDIESFASTRTNYLQVDDTDIITSKR